MDLDIDWSTKLLEFILAAGGVIGILGVFVKRIYRMARNIEEVLEMAQQNHAATVKAGQDVQDLHAEHRAMQQEIMAIKAEVKPNGGSSLRDAVNRIDHRMDIFEARDYGRTA